MSVASVCTHTPGQSLLSAVLVIVSSRPATHIYSSESGQLRLLPWIWKEYVPPKQYQTTWCRNPEHHKINLRWRANLRSDTNVVTPYLRDNFPCRHDTCVWRLNADISVLKMAVVPWELAVSLFGKCWLLNVGTKVASPDLHYMLHMSKGHAVEALCYKPEGRGFDSRWGNWIFQLT
jgi:hypothetical protein